MNSNHHLSSMRHPRSRRTAILVLTGSAAALLFMQTPSVRGQASVVDATYTNSAATGSWIVGTNWSTNPQYPDGIDAGAFFTSIQTANRTISLNDAITVGELSITNSTAFTNTINAGTNGTLEFDAAASPVTISSLGTGAVANTISAPMILTDSIIANVANTAGNQTSGALSLTGAMSGPGGLTKSGTGTLTISTNAKTYTGPTLFDTDTGRTRISASGSITGSSSVTVNQGAQITLIATTGNSNYTLGNVLNLNGTGLGVGSPQGNFPGAIRNDTGLVAIIASPVVLQSDTLIHVQATGALVGSTTFSNTVSGPGKLTLTAPNSNVNQGELVLANANSYQGGSLVNGGTLVANNPNSTFGTGDVAVDNALSPDSNAKLTIQTGVLNAIADTATLSLAGGRVANTPDTGFADLGAGVNETVGGLFLAGAEQPVGTYGSTASPATFQNNEFFSGSGIVTVIPEPGAAAMLIGALVPLLGLRRSRQR